MTALVPARIDTRWRHDHIAGYTHVFLLRGRPSFGAIEEAVPFPSALILSGGDAGILSRFRQAFPAAWYVPPAGLPIPSLDNLFQTV